MTALVRARYGATTVPSAVAPYDAVHFRIFHPALFTGTEVERQTGSLPPDTVDSPWPVAIVLGGINVNPDGYRWLATALAAEGTATVLFHHVGEVTPGDVGLSPGLDLTALSPDAWRTRPSGTAIGPLVEALHRENSTGPLTGLLDLDRVALIGHSAGGTIAFVNADRDWFGIGAAVSYAGHTMPAAMLGHPAGTVLPMTPGVPALVIGGGNDAVIAASVARYRDSDDPVGDTPAPQHDPIAATFDRGTSTPGSTLVILRSATHLTFCDPIDPTSARGFLELPDPDGPAHRALIHRLISAFLGEVLPHRDAKSAGVDSTVTLEALGSDPAISVFRRW